MGYRHYFYLVKKLDVEKCNNTILWVVRNEKD